MFTQKKNCRKFFSTQNFLFNSEDEENFLKMQDRNWKLMNGIEWKNSEIFSQPFVCVYNGKGKYENLIKNFIAKW